MTQRQAVTKKMALSYQGADRAGKSRILTELGGLTGWHRDYARTALRDALRFKVVMPPARPGRAPTYGPVVTKALVKCWAVLRAPAGKRLAPIERSRRRDPAAETPDRDDQVDRQRGRARHQSASQAEASDRAGARRARAVER